LGFFDINLTKISQHQDNSFMEYKKARINCIVSSDYPDEEILFAIAMCMQYGETRLKFQAEKKRNKLMKRAASIIDEINKNIPVTFIDKLTEEDIL